MSKEKERFEKTVKALIEVMTKKSLAQLVAAFLMLEEEQDSINGTKQTTS